MVDGRLGGRLRAAAVERVLVFATASASRAWRGSPRPPGHGGALRAPGVRTLAVVFVLIGVAFGAVEVAVPAAADAAGTPSAAGWLLGIWGFGSFVGGLLAARGTPPGRPRAPAVHPARRCWPPATRCSRCRSGLYALAALLLLAGGAIAPSFGLAYGLVDTAAPEGTVTEAFTWLTTGIAAGLAGGSALAGVLAEGPGAEAGFLVAAVGARGRGAVRGRAAADDHAARRGRAACRDVAVTAALRE